MFNKVLVANRGEIAVRVIRACKELGLRTVAVFSEADRDALHVQLADERVCIGPAPSKKSYLSIPAILAACKMTGAQAVHPGFGFLSENAEFARMCEQNNIIFVGPSTHTIYTMGDKARAKQTMVEAGVPVIPGSDGVMLDILEAIAVVERIGYPLLVKASAGGGGRGIRLVESADELERAVHAAKLESGSCFGDDSVYLEKFLRNPRHVEVQIIADTKGNVIHLGERDCSLQRRNQKVLEECPSPSRLMTPELRTRMGAAAVKAAKAANYKGAGTVEFLLDSNDNFYFMEMNTRIQVEHPITEEVVGVDIVKKQLQIAAGEALGLTQDDIKMNGYAIECRINAENPLQDFRPSPGKIQTLRLPGGPGIRIDSAIYPGYCIPPNYDSMVAKLIAHAPTRMEAIAKMRMALSEFRVTGINTNISLHKTILENAVFVSGEYHIGSLTEIVAGL